MGKDVDPERFKDITVDSGVESVSLEQEKELLFNSSWDLQNAANKVQAVTSHRQQGYILPSVSAVGDDIMNISGVQVSPRSTNTINPLGNAVLVSSVDGPTSARSGTDDQNKEHMDVITESTHPVEGSSHSIVS